jgi:uncharacterized protein YgbK (DUF1537 family)
MYTLLVLADDLTGALDTGVQFVKRGIPTRVCPDWRDAKDRKPESGEASFPSSGEGALVINTGTRRRSPAEARNIIGGILEQYPAVPFIYKKTDSTLRGHIGAELEALALARNLDILPFVPAYPALGRSTRQGRQYLEGVPIDKTTAAADALNPVHHSFIPAIIAEESALPVRLIPRRGPGEDSAFPSTDKTGGDKPGAALEPEALPALKSRAFLALKPVSGPVGVSGGVPAEGTLAGMPVGARGGPGRASPGGPEIWVYDAETNADLRDIAGGLEKQGLLRITAGCAGFAEFLVDFIPFAGGDKPGAHPALKPVSAPNGMPATGVSAGVPPGAGESGGGPRPDQYSKPDSRLKPDRRPILIVSGSRHPVSLSQIRAAREAGIPALALEEEFLRPGWFTGDEAASLVSRCGDLLRTTGCCILGTRLSLGQGPAAPEGGVKPVSGAGEDAGGGTAGPLRDSGIAECLGSMVRAILRLAGPARLAVFGGDTLLGVMEALNCRLLRPLREIRPGVVLAEAEAPGESFSIAAKSGAFGEPGLIAELIDFFGGGNPKRGNPSERTQRGNLNAPGLRRG